MHSTKLDRLRSHAATATEADKSNADSSSQCSGGNDGCDIPSKMPRMKRAIVSGVKIVANTCIFCDKPGDDLRQAMTFQLDQRVRHCANAIDDHALLGKLMAGDMIATEAKYHPGCLLSLYRKTAQVESTNSAGTAAAATADTGNVVIPNIESLALAAIVAYVEDARCNNETPRVFKLSELGNLYVEQLQRHGVVLHAKLNISRFKETLLASCAELTAVPHGRDVLLTFNEHLGATLKQMNANPDSDAVKMVHTAKLVRAEIFSSEYTFDGTFKDSFTCQCHRHC